MNIKYRQTKGKKNDPIECSSNLAMREIFLFEPFSQKVQEMDIEKIKSAINNIIEYMSK